MVLTIAGSSLVTIPLNLVGTAAHQALLRILRWPLLYLALFVALACPYRYGRAAAISMAVGRWVTWGNVPARPPSGIAGAVLVRVKLRKP